MPAWPVIGRLQGSGRASMPECWGCSRDRTWQRKQLCYLLMKLKKFLLLEAHLTFQLALKNTVYWIPSKWEFTIICRVWETALPTQVEVSGQEFCCCHLMNTKDDVAYWSRIWPLCARGWKLEYLRVYGLSLKIDSLRWVLGQIIAICFREQVKGRQLCRPLGWLSSE